MIMYLVGRFNRDYYNFSNNENPMSLVGLVEEISKSHLQSCVSDEDYQVINLITREYFDPKQNKWVKIGRF